MVLPEEGCRLRIYIGVSDRHDGRPLYALASVAALPATAIAFTVSPMTAVWVIVFYLVVQQLESNILTPVVMRGTVRLPPAMTIFFQSLVFGFLGWLLAAQPSAPINRVLRRALAAEHPHTGRGSARFRPNRVDGDMRTCA